MSYASMGQLLPRDFLERQPKRWQKSQRKRRVLGTLRKMKVKREKLEVNYIAKVDRLAGVPNKRPTSEPEDEPSSEAKRAKGASSLAKPSATASVPAHSHSTSIGMSEQGMWAAELVPYQALVVRIPDGVELCLLRASLTEPDYSAGDGGGGVTGVSALRCRTPAVKSPSTLCALSPLVNETASLHSLFTARDRSLALAVEGPSTVHIVGCYMRKGLDGAAPPPAPAPPRPPAQPSQKPQPAAADSKKAAAPSPASAAPQLIDLGDGLKYTDVKKGSGRKAARGNKLTVRYTGLAPDSKAASGWREFDSNRGKPFHFTLGGSEVIRGWDAGLIGMKQGGTRRLVIPPHLGYGDAGAGPIPPKATLIFEITLQNVVGFDK